jgi:alpha-aminoadipate carrier protein LysW
VPTAICPECEEEVYVDSDAEQGEVVTCEECDADLELVGLDPIELDLFKGNDDRDQVHEELDEYERQSIRY